MYIHTSTPKRIFTWLNARTVKLLLLCGVIWLGLGILASYVMDMQTAEAFGHSTAKVVAAISSQDFTAEDFRHGFGPGIIKQLDARFSPDLLKAYQIKSIKVFDLEGKVVYATNKTEIGQYETNDLESIRKGRLAASLEQGYLSIFAPIKLADQTKTLGTLEIYLASGDWDKLMWNMRLVTWSFMLVSALLVFAAIHILVSRATATIENKNEVMESTSAGTVSALLKALDAKDRYTARHSANVASYAVKIGVVLGLSPAELELLQTAAILHDIGKIGIPEHILNKCGSLDSREFELVQKHSELGAQIVEFVYLLKEAAEIILYHHERFGGGGYPKGLKGEEIPLSSRILTAADVYDALTTDRPYRAAVPSDKARQLLVAGMGSQFDPVVIEAFLLVLKPEEAA